MPIKVKYKVNESISSAQFIVLLVRSTLAERRPIEDQECMKGMVENSNLIVSAWENDKLVGVARSMTDFHYACYLSDLAVDEQYQQYGIGKKLIDLSQQQLKSQCRLVLVAAPAAAHYYPHIGFSEIPSAWVLPRQKRVGD